MKKFVFFAVALAALCFAPKAHAAITFDASSTAKQVGFSAGPRTASSSFTVGSANPNPVLIMCANIFQDTGGVGAVSAATYNGVALTKFATSTRSTNMSAECWDLINPPTGSHKASTTVTGATDDIQVWWAVFDGVNQTTPITATGTFTGAGTTSSVSITPSAATDFIVDTISRFGTNALNFGTGQTSIASTTGTSAKQGGSYEAATSTSAVKMTWNWTTANDSEQIAFNLVAAAAAVAPKQFNRCITMDW